MVKRDKSDEVNLMQSLQDPEEAAACIDPVMELKDKAALLLALRWVAKAHGMELQIMPLWVKKHLLSHWVMMKALCVPHY